MRRLISLACFATFLSSSVAFAICDDIAYLEEMAKDNFASIKVDPREKMRPACRESNRECRRFYSTFNLSGADDCRIGARVESDAGGGPMKSSYYQCDWQFIDGDVKAAEDYLYIGQQIETCMGWKKISEIDDVMEFDRSGINVDISLEGHSDSIYFHFRKLEEITEEEQLKMIFQ